MHNRTLNAQSTISTSVAGYDSVVMMKVYVSSLKKVFDDSKKFFVDSRKISNGTFERFGQFITASDEWLLPYTLFSDFYELPDAEESINKFLIYFDSLPNELRFLKSTVNTLFSSRLSLLLNPGPPELNAPGLDEKIKSVVNSQRSGTIDADKIDLYCHTLIKIKDIKLASIKKTLQAANQYLKHDREYIINNPDNYKEIAELLDTKLKKSFHVIMMNYLIELLVMYKTSPKPDVTLIKRIVFEIKATQSPLAFYNKQLGFAFKRGDFDYLKNKISLDTQELFKKYENLYCLCKIALFSIDFPSHQLTKSNYTSATRAYIDRIATQGNGWKEKLIQFQALYCLAQVFANKHSNPKWDEKLGIHNTRTWKVLMTEIRGAAFAQLTDQSNYANQRDYLPALVYSLKLPLFKEHRGNYTELFFTRPPATIAKINMLITQHKQPREFKSQYL